MKQILSIATAIIFCGCATDTNSPERGPGGTIAYFVHVETEQPGCRIEVDGDYVGKSPLTIKVFGDKDGTFHGFGKPQWTITAYPTAGGGMVQTKKFGTGTWFMAEDRIPKTIYFNTALDTVQPRERIDVNVNQK